MRLLPKKVNEDVKAEQIRLLYQQGATVQIIGLIASLAAVSLFWNVIDHSWLVVWFVSMLFLSLVRLEMNRRFNKISSGYFRINRWANLYVVGTFLSGVLWGSLSFFYEPSWPTSYQLMIFVMYTGLIAGAYNTNSSYFISFPAFYLPPSLSILYVMIQLDINGALELSFLFSMYIISMYFSSLKLNDGLTEALELRFENEKIAKKLESSNIVLTELANMDGLTGLHNRRSMDKFLLNKWNEHYENKEYITLILIDIDFFKEFNDTYGHSKGDECLKEVAAVLSNDIRSKFDMVARYGGEEFALILSNTNKDTALKIAERIRNDVLSLKIPHKSSKANDYVTISIGIASLIPASYNSPLIALQTADKALYLSKSNGRNCIEYLDIQ